MCMVEHSTPTNSPFAAAKQENNKNLNNMAWQPIENALQSMTRNRTYATSITTKDIQTTDNKTEHINKYSRRGIYNQRGKYNQWPFRSLFSYVKFFFSIFFFLHLKLRTICYTKQEKKVRKDFVLEVKN